jgi:hypothetical protein
MFITHTQIHLTIFKNNQTKQVQVPDTKSLTISDFISPPPPLPFCTCVSFVCACVPHVPLFFFIQLFSVVKNKNTFDKNSINVMSDSCGVEPTHN